MGGFFLLGLLGVGALIGLIDFLDDDSSVSPSAPGTEDDVRVGTNGNDEITAIATGEEVEAAGGADTVNGGAGSDTLSGEAGRDVLSGAEGSDILFGGSGADILDGGAGADVMSGGAGDDVLQGGADDDVLSGESGSDLLNGGLGDDALFGTSTVLQTANAGDFAGLVAQNEPNAIDALYLPPVGSDDGDAQDTLFGGFGDDLLVLGSSDLGAGGEGDDIFTLGDWITEGNSATILDFSPEEDQIVYTFDLNSGTPEDVAVTDDGAGNAVITIDGQIVATVTGAAATITVEDVALVSRTSSDSDGAVYVGTSADNDVELTNNADLANLGAGDDFAAALGGNDAVDGEAGDDTVLGGAGDDILRGGADSDLILDSDGSDILSGGLGDDTLDGGGFISENSIIAGATPDVATADFGSVTDTGADTLVGGFGSDTLLFGPADLVSGGAFADSFYTTDAGIEAGASTITDFDINEDMLFVSLTSDSAAAITISYSEGATDTSGDATVLVGGTALMVLEGVGTSFTVGNLSVSTRAA